MTTHYLEGGISGADKIVLIHDGAFGADCWITWSSLMPRLAGRFHVFAPDLLGFGGTHKIYDFGRGARSQKIDHLAAWMKALDIRAAHVLELDALPRLHGDPFDRVLIAQSRVENLPLVSSDGVFDKYPVELFW